MTDAEREERRIGLVPDSQGDIDPDEKGDNDDIIYVDLTRDSESQDWLSSFSEKRKGFSELSAEERENLKRRFKNKMEGLTQKE